MVATSTLIVKVVRWSVWIIESLYKSYKSQLWIETVEEFWTLQNHAQKSYFVFASVLFYKYIIQYNNEATIFGLFKDLIEKILQQWQFCMSPVEKREVYR